MKNEQTKFFEQLARKASKDIKIKELLLDMSHHFKQKDAWGLSYDIYLEMSKLLHPVFGQLLKIKKYTVVFYDGNLLIKKGK
jgi:hypothetical protein